MCVKSWLNACKSALQGSGMVRSISRHMISKHPALLAHLGRAALLLTSTSRLAVSASSLTLSRWYLQQQQHHKNSQEAMPLPWRPQAT
jgi:hypothetical protein